MCVMHAMGLDLHSRHSVLPVAKGFSKVIYNSPLEGSSYVLSSYVLSLSLSVLIYKSGFIDLDRHFRIARKS